MARGDAAPYVLFGENSQCIYSPAFVVYPGEVLKFIAYGFSKYRIAQDPEKPKLLQVACLESLVYAGEDTFDNCPAANGIWEIDPGRLIESELVYINDCAWSLSTCNNLAFLDIPGTYRLLLNDPGAVGFVRVYLWRYKLSVLNWAGRVFWGKGYE